jgi:hypothetical protein
MKKLLKSIIYATAPGLGNYITAVRNRRHFRTIDQGFQGEVASKIFKGTPIEVLSGPFKGLKYINETVWGPITPKWMGSYEEELHGIVEQIIQSNYDTIIDVGSAEGYYVAGLAKRMPKARVYSFDVDSISRRQQSDIIKLNNLTNVTIGKYCHHSDLDTLITNNTLVICDIEGYEYDLLDLTKSKKLAQADVLVEVHPFGDKTLADVEATLKNRFKATHHIEHIQQKKRQSIDYHMTQKQLLTEAEFMRCVDEYRNFADQTWFWMKRKR